MRKYNYLAFCTLAALFGSTSVFANTSENCTAKDEDCEKPVVTLDTITLTATRTETSTDKYAGQISIINGKQLKQSANIVDTLSKVPGLEAGGDAGRAIGSQYTIRGFGYQSEQRVIIRQNGVPQSPSLFSNHISSFRTDTDILQRVEVVKGASSVLYGSGAIGGIIDMQTKGAQDYLSDGETLGGLLGMRYESNNMHSVRAGVYGKAEDVPVDFVVYGKLAKHGDIDLADGGTESYDTIDNDEEIKTAYFNLGWDISDEQRIDVSVFDFSEDLTTVWQTLYFYEIDDESPIIGSLQQTDYVLDYSFDSDSNDYLNITAKVYASDASYSRGWDYVDSDTGKRETLTYENKESRWGFNIKNLAELTTGQVKHSLLTGLEFNNREEDAIYNRNGKQSDFGSMPNSYEDWGLYIQDIIEYQALTLTMAGRFDKFDRSVEKVGKTDYDDSNFSPRVAVAYELVDGFTLLFGYAETFRAPTPHETSSEGALNPHFYYLPNPDLGAETAKEFEGGFSFNHDSLFTNDDQLSIKATYYDGKIEDMISLKRLPGLGKPPESREYAQYRNVAKAKRDGYEINADYLMSNWQFAASYEHLDIYDAETKEKVAQGFADKLQLNATWFAHDMGLQLGLGVDHWFKPDQNPKTLVSRGKTYTYVDQTFTQVNLRGHWDVPFEIAEFVEHARVNFGVNNLTDKKYINARNVNTTSRVGPGVNAYIDIEVDF